MSSNPFRRSRTPIEADPASVSIFAAIRHASDVTASTPTTTSKRVVVQSPPQSPGDLSTQRNGDHALAPADSARRAPVHSETAACLGEDDVESESTRRAGSDADPLGISLRDSWSVDRTAGAARAPYNPFARTLASKEAGYAERNDGEVSEANGIDHKTKPALDVDAFKNILLTGAPLPAGLSATTAAAGGRDSHSNSTDASSVLDRNYALHPGSPRDDFDDYESASENDPTEHSGLMGAGRFDDVAPPALPKPKKGPQTVSFADFDQSIPPDFISPRPRTPSVRPEHLTGILRSASPRLGGDVNKPLPAPPHNTTATTISTTTPPNTLSPAIAPASVLPSAAKPIPPPPPARKSGVGAGRARSGSNLSNMTLESSLPDPVDPVLSATPSKNAPPPPPPTRKAHSSGTPTPPARDVQQNSTDAKLAPPPPPPIRRLPSKSSKGSSNVNRQSSDDSATAPRPVSMVGGAGPPPPPPRRPYSSKRTSLDGPHNAYVRRLSGEHHRGASFDSERSPSISSLQKVAEGGEAGSSPSPDQSRDILAEMSAFQAEIEALAQAQKGK